MKKLILTIICVVASACAMTAQNVLNAEADSIVGEYETSHQGEHTKIRVTKDTDGTYRAQLFWVEDRLDKDGDVRLDRKNPDKSLRHVPCDEIVLMSGLKYDSAHQNWGGTKIYDPTRGIRANVVCEFLPDGLLRVKGSLLGFSQSIYWEKLPPTAL